MIRKRKGLDVGSEKASVELLKDLLIVELGKASVPQLQIRKIVGCDIPASAGLSGI